jgi:hypothetical protein
MDKFKNLFDSLSNSFGEGIPKLLAAIAVIILGFIVAGIIKRIVTKLLGRTKIDEKLAAKFNSSFRIDTFVAKLVYYIVVLYALIFALGMMGITEVTDSLQSMLKGFVGFVPNIVGAGIIGFAGYVIATILSEATSFLSERLENFGRKMGISAGSVNLTKILKQVVFIIVFIPILIVALDTLEMKVISEPASEMLGGLLNSVPKIIAAAILLAVFFIIGRYVVGIVTELLRNVGLDKFAGNLGLNSVLGEASLSSIIGNIALFFIMFTGIIAACDKLELEQVEGILTNIFGITGRVFFGLIILMAGLFISNLAEKALSGSKSNGYLVPIVRFAILGIFLAFGLHTMGIAESIVNLAFGLTLGSVAVAFALSFGLGGREAAGEEMKSFFKNIKK